jgi:hypothetical protein
MSHTIINGCPFVLPERQTQPFLMIFSSPETPLLWLTNKIYFQIDYLTEIAIRYSAIPIESLWGTDRRNDLLIQK